MKDVFDTILLPLLLIINVPTYMYGIWVHGTGYMWALIWLCLYMLQYATLYHYRNR
jgi:hypothetical protein